MLSLSHRPRERGRGRACPGKGFGGSPRTGLSWQLAPGSLGLFAAPARTLPPQLAFARLPSPSRGRWIPTAARPSSRPHPLPIPGEVPPSPGPLVSSHGRVEGGAERCCNQTMAKGPRGVTATAALLLLGLLSAQRVVESPVEPDASAILVSQRGLRIPLGRSLSLDPAAELVLRVRPGDRCAVAVLRSGPGPQPAGLLHPPRFSCAFACGQVTYTHFGALSLGRYRLHLQLRYDSPRFTLFLPFTLEVEVVFQQLRLLSRNLPLPADKLRGLSAPLDGKVLELPEGEPGRRCRFTLLPPEAAGAGPLPAYGRLLDARGRPLPADCSGDCSAVLQEGIRYQHTAATASPGRDCIPARLSVLPASGPEQREHFHALVRIHEGADNMLPKPSFLALL